MSLDGFAEDKDGKLDFFPASETDKFPDQDQLKFLDSVDTILLGRRTYDTGVLALHYAPQREPQQ